MNIREIAKVANVSPATVSKVLNGRDASISQQTRERILRLVKEYHYTPFTNQKKTTQRTLLLGVLLDETINHESLLAGIVKEARRDGYSTIVCTSTSAEEEKKNISALLSHGVDGLIWERRYDCMAESAQMLEKETIPYICIDPESPITESNFYFDFAVCGGRAVKALTDLGHRKICCAVDTDTYASRQLCEGYRTAMFAYDLAPGDPLIINDVSNIDAVDIHSCTAIICENRSLAKQIYNAARKNNLRVPKDLSILCFDQTKNEQMDNQAISTLILKYDQLGKNIIRSLIDRIEDREPSQTDDLLGEIDTEATLASPDVTANPSIVVVGTINMDTLFQVKKLPEFGQTTSAENRITLPGGKALNQAIGCCRLGADACIIGRLGKDYEGSVVYNYLKSNRVSTDGIITDVNAITGSANITVCADGESTIVIHRGANGNLTKEDILRNEHLFRGTSFCLLQTELKTELALCAAQIARKNGTKVILKPCTEPELSSDLLQYVDYLVPNRREMEYLYPGTASLSDKAQHFLDMGVSCVIVTLGHNGCFVKDAGHERYFTALNVRPVDTTGASDAFVAALAVYLSKGRELDDAVRYATCAAGISTMHQGVPTSLPDNYSVELFLRSELAAGITIE